MKKSNIISYKEITHLQIKEYEAIQKKILEEEMRGDNSTSRVLVTYQKIIEDVGRFGVLKGYDAIDVNFKNYCILLHRAIAIMV
jgi:hypothetical protein